MVCNIVGILNMLKYCFMNYIRATLDICTAHIQNQIGVRIDIHCASAVYVDDVYPLVI